MNKLSTTTLFVLLMAITSANAAIVYRDIPDGIPTGLDFNSDGTNEISISNSFLSGQGTYLTYSLPSNVYGISSGQWDAAAALDFGFSIGATGNWFGFGDCTVTGNSHPTTFPLNADKYLGFKINIAGSIYYGWARVYVTAAGTGPLGTTYLVTYKDYAYNNTPNTGINAGDTGNLGINNNLLQPEPIVYPNPTTEYITVQLNGNTTIEKIKLYDHLGKLILSEKISNKQDSNIRLNLNNLQRGVYFLHYEDKKQYIKIEKILLE